MTDTTTIDPGLAATLETYLQMWNEPDAGRRAELIAAVFTEDGRHVDASVDARGHAALNEMVGAVQAHFAGHQIRPTSGIDAHNDQFRIGWELVGPDGTVALAGFDAGEVADDGRLVRVTGFWGDLPAA